MPTKNPRLTITLEPALAAQLRRLSELTGNSQGKLIAEILEGSGQVFERVIKVLEAAQLATSSLQGSAKVDLDAAQARIESQLGLLIDDFDQTTLPLLEEAESVKRRGARVGMRKRPGAGASSAVTPPSNRGVRSVDNSHGEKPRRRK